MEHDMPAASQTHTNMDAIFEMYVQCTLRWPTLTIDDTGKLFRWDLQQAFGAGVVLCLVWCPPMFVVLAVAVVVLVLVMVLVQNGVH